MPFENLFDGLETLMFNVTTNQFGYEAVWMPSQNAFNLDFGDDFLTGPQTALVHYKDSTAAFDLTGQKFDLPRFRMEYHLPDFRQLKASVDDSGASERVVIEIKGELREFDIVSVDTVYDGDTCVAYLNPVGD